MRIGKTDAYGVSRILRIEIAKRFHDCAADFRG